MTLLSSSDCFRFFTTVYTNPSVSVLLSFIKVQPPSSLHFSFSSHITSSMNRFRALIVICRHRIYSFYTFALFARTAHTLLIDIASFARLYAFVRSVL
jgi:hypothetical protein